jgi:hypothetical protein
MDETKRIWFEGRYWTVEEFDAETSAQDEQELNEIMELHANPSK